MSHIGGYGLAYYLRCFAQRSISAKYPLLFLNIFVALIEGVFLYKKTILELSIILISPDGSNDLPHFAMLIRLYVTKLSIIVFNNTPHLLNNNCNSN